ncbi:MAG: cytochrome b/b6 domain-containing protein [Chloroflexi bacterium]|nr:cytochrome b/b6 domain-containing protein [Chloroflexota bacterium]
MSTRTMRKVMRYRPVQRKLHWVGASGFLMLLLTGLVLLWSPLSFLAAGGISRQLHLIGAVLFVTWPFLYAIFDGREFKELIVESFSYDRDDWNWLTHALGYFFGHVRQMPPQGRLNAGQKAHHAGTILGYLSVAVSGVALWYFKGRLGADMLALIAIVHDLSMLALTILLVGHLYFTFVYDALSAMTNGYISESSAQLEHAKWLATLPRQAPWVVGAPAETDDNKTKE